MKMKNSYLMLWFDVNGRMYGCFCTRKNLRKGFVKIRLRNGNVKKDVDSCEWVSKFFLFKNKTKFLKWDDRNELIEMYPKLKCVLA